MPTVPRRSTGYVPTSPLPGVRAPSSAFEPPTPVDFSPETKLASRLLEEQQGRADQAAIISADAKLAQLHNQLLYDPQNGAIGKRGLDAAPAHRSAIESFDKGSSDIASGLSGNQRLVFEKQAASRKQDFDQVLAHHAQTETDRITIEATLANLDAERTATLQAYADPGRVQKGVDHTKTLLLIDGASRGDPPEVTQQRITEEVSKIHSGVINLLLADDKDIDATKYFQAHSGELDSKALLQAKDSLDLGSLRGESQRRADGIVQSSATLGGALSEAQKITDPKLREATEGRIRRHFEDVDTSLRYDREQAYEQASAVLEQTHDLHKIPPALYNRLNAAQHRELEHRLTMMRNPERTTNWSTYARLLNQAGLNDSTRAEFEQTDLTKYRDELSDSDYSRLLSLQLGERRQTGGAMSSELKRQAQASERDVRKDVDRQKAAEMLRGMGVDIPSPKVPGAPLGSPGVQLRASPKGKQVPKSWIDRASKDENYKRYLEHMGVIFDK